MNEQIEKKLSRKEIFESIKLGAKHLPAFEFYRDTETSKRKVYENLQEHAKSCQGCTGTKWRPNKNTEEQLRAAGFDTAGTAGTGSPAGGDDGEEPHSHEGDSMDSSRSFDDVSSNDDTSDVENGALN